MGQGWGGGGEGLCCHVSCTAEMPHTCTALQELERWRGEKAEGYVRMGRSFAQVNALFEERSSQVRWWRGAAGWIQWIPPRLRSRCHGVPGVPRHLIQVPVWIPRHAGVSLRWVWSRGLGGGAGCVPQASTWYSRADTSPRAPFAPRRACGQ